MITPSDVQQLVEEHDQYWSERHGEMRRLKAIYMMRFWERDTDALVVETSRAYEYVESQVASLFVRNPSVEVDADLRGAGDPTITEAVANNWLLHTRRLMERTTRLALIYPLAFMKLSTTDDTDVLRRVEMTPVGPWDILVDDTANSWETQRYVGHKYYMSLEAAKEKYGSKQFAKRSFVRFIDLSLSPEPSPDDRDTSALDDFILVVEIYDLTHNKLRVWSPDFRSGKAWLYDGIELDVGDEGTPEKFEGIPFETASGRVLVPIVPMFMGQDPTDPMRGFSSLRRVYDPVVETNTIRTFQANAVRKCARQWLTRDGVLTDEAITKIAQGVDGEFITVDLSPGESLRDAVVALPHNPTPPELQTYQRQVDDDFARGSLMAPFTRGEATKATATEITALAAYSASEIGRMARERDHVISTCAQTYVVMIATLLGEDSETVRLGGEAKVVLAEDLTGDFSFYAHDSGSTPISEAVKKQELLSLVPVLLELAVPANVILEQVVRAFDLPESFLPPPGGPPPTPAAPPPGAVPPGPVPPDQQHGALGLAPGQVPSASRIGGVLPLGGAV